MYVQIDNGEILAFADYAFNGYTVEFPLISFSDYASNPEKYIFDGETITIRSNWEEIETIKREKEFKSQFFNIENSGYFRKSPKGYSSATEAMNTAFNIVITLGFLPSDTLTFYKEPNFANAKECTEEWLISNSYKNTKMTTEEFGKFYADFVTAWNREEHL